MRGSGTTRLPAVVIASVVAAGLALAGLTPVPAAAVPAADAAAAPEQAGNGTTVVVVSADDAAAVGEARRLAGRTEGVQLETALPELDTVALEVPVAEVAELVRDLERVEGVAAVEAAVPRRPMRAPDDPEFGGAQSYLSTVRAPEAWEISRGSPAVRIAVVDTGVDVSHPDLAGKVVASFDAVTGGSDVSDADGHGTFVAGVAAAATDNAAGIAGAGWDSSIVAVKVAGPGGLIQSQHVARGIVWAADPARGGAQIVNVSLGSEEPSTVEAEAIAYARSKGVLVVASAGNSGAAGNPPMYPAAVPEVLAVGATDGATRAGFSSYGLHVDVAAPGVAVRSTQPGGSYGAAHGTSFAAPLVAGQAALLLAHRPGTTPAELTRAITASATPMPRLGLGAGRVDFLASFAHLPPSGAAVPVLPAPGQTVSGEVAVTVRADAPAVRFRVGTTWLGPPVPVRGGAASTTWSTYGWRDGTHALTAALCSGPDACAQEGTQIRLVVANPAPELTRVHGVTLPVRGPAVAVNGPLTVEARSGGGSLALLVDGRRVAASGPPVARRGGTATFRLTMPSALADGPHSVAVVQCSADAAVCAGTSSRPTPVVVRALHPAVRLTNPAFSPNRDGRKDATVAVVSAPEAQRLTLRVLDARGAVVKGPVPLALRAGGRTSWAWDGTNTRGRRMSDGRYTVVVEGRAAAGATTLRGRASSSIAVDTAAPALSVPSGSGGSVFPHRDGYRDTFGASATVSEPGSARLTVRTAAGRAVRTVAAPVARAGAVSLTWDGRDARSRVVPTGSYRWAVTVEDAAGNVRTSRTGTVAVSAKRAETRTARLTLAGSDAVETGSDDTCASAGRPGGASGRLRLRNDCPTAEGAGDVLGAGAVYRFALPRAQWVESVAVRATVASGDRPTLLLAQAADPHGGEGHEVVGTAEVATSTPREVPLGEVAPRLARGGVVDIGLVLANLAGPPPRVLDVQAVSLDVTYVVLV